MGQQARAAGPSFFFFDQLTLVLYAQLELYDQALVRTACSSEW
jgi:hypothetical protein